MANATTLCCPAGISIDSMGVLYIADQDNNRVLEYLFPLLSTTANDLFGQAGQFSTTVCNKNGISADSLCAPSALANDSSNNLYIADTQNSRVLEYNDPQGVGGDTTADRVFGQNNSFVTASCNGGGPAPNAKTLCGPAGVALDAGNEDLAKKALAKKAESDKQVTSMQTAVEQAKAASEKLKQQVTELKGKIDEGERTATTLVARKNAAAAQRKVAEAMSGVGNADNAFAQLNRFEESVSKEEATAKAFDQLASAGKDDDLEKQFAQLGGHSVDSELEALKAERWQLKAGGPPPPYVPKELPTGSASIASTQNAGEKAGV